MADKKASTLQEKLGFLDADLKSPKHDEIMIWLDQNAQSICEFLYPPNLFLQNSIKQSLQWFKRDLGNRDWPNKDEILKRLKESVPHADPSIQASKQWEVPVLSNTKYIIGFIDFVATCLYTELDIVYPDPRMNEARWIETPSEGFSIAFEVKTTIPSAGEVIRQINTYRTHLTNHYFVIVSPDPTHSKIFQSQNIQFVTYLPNYSGPNLTEVLNQLRAADAA